MPAFAYKAVNNLGKAVRGRMEAVNLVDLEMRLRRLGLDFIDGSLAQSRRSPWSRGGIKRQELIAFCFHLEQLTRSGVPLMDGLIDLRDSLDDSHFREIVAGLVESIEGGRSLSQAMGESPLVFDKVFVSLIRTGEETGRLPDVLKDLTENLKWEDELAAQARKAMVYPALVGSIIIGVTMFMLIYLVPQLTGFLKNVGTEMPLQTRILLACSEIVVKYWYLVLATPVFVLAGLRALIKSSPRYRYLFDDLKLRLPIVGDILRKIVLSRFATVLAMMYTSGIRVVDAIRLTEDVVGNVVVRDALRQVREQIGEGRNLTQAFHSVGIFPPLVLRMLRVGESTGNLDTALLNVSYFYTREVREGIGRLQAMIEPVMTLALGVILGWVMMAVLGPVYDAISKIKF